ncbi:hypothetical protein ACFQZE_18290 [Paenibacillus sp. GCM10027627]|uniref:hypothetical protein n=1 Tax=unclassified Paenibacillus TaxID=185978 RepID=UPI00362AF5A6
MRRRRRFKKAIWIVLSIVLIGIGYLIAGNKWFHTKYESLNETDRAMFAQLNELHANTANSKEALWEDYNLHKLPIVLVAKGEILNNSKGTWNGLRKGAYAVGISGLDNKWYTKKIAMPDHFELQHVYRLSALTPGMGSTWNPIGNFSSIDQNLSIGDTSRAYYFKYNKKNLENPIKTSQYFIPFLVHENFHHVMQQHWAIESGDLSLEGKNTEWFEYLGYQYTALDGVKDALAGKDREAIKHAIAEYVVISELRKQKDNNAYSMEKLHETSEGSATYVGMKASSLVSTPPLPFLAGAQSEDQRKFSYLFTVMARNPGFLSEIKWSRYDSGALLCFALDRLYGNSSWQSKLNAQKTDLPVTLYELVKQYYDEHGLIDYAASAASIMNNYDVKRIRDEAKRLDDQT